MGAQGAPKAPKRKPKVKVVPRRIKARELKRQSNETNKSTNYIHTSKIHTRKLPIHRNAIQRPTRIIIYNIHSIQRKTN